MDEQVNKLRRQKIAKAIAWTLAALVIMLLGLKSCLSESYRIELEKVESEKIAYQDTIRHYRGDTVSNYIKIVDSLKKLINEESALAKELALMQETENRLKEVDAIYSSFLEANNDYISALHSPGNRGTPDKRKRNELAKELSSHLDSIGFVTQAGFNLLDSTFEGSSRWISIYSELINNKIELIEAYSSQGICCESPPAHRLFHCDKCDGCPDYQRRSPPAPTAGTGADCSQVEIDLAICNTTTDRIKEDLESLLSGKVTRKHISKIINRYWK